ncbi:site-specific integrase [Geobacter sp.]|uniref:site-specific integrase n=1 Tax=Geobacter sp. TaxID=46610 RepID=UPI0027BA8A31|nr:site-specific integrase [Geobacter sp.]
MRQKKAAFCTTNFVDRKRLFMFLARRMKNRNGKFHYRRRVPTKFRDDVFFSLVEFTTTLNTKNPSEARTLKSFYDTELDKIIVALRVGALDAEMARQKVDALLCTQKFKASSSTNSPPVPAPFAGTSPSSKPSKSLEQLIKEYVAEKSVKWTEKTQMEYSGIFGKIADMLGRKKPVNHFTRQDIVNFRTSLRAERSVSTTNKYLTTLSSLFKYGVQLDYMQKNFAEGLHIEDERKESEHRSIYSDNELQTLVDLLLRNREAWHRERQPERFWVPLIALFSGMRVDEICQLYVMDIKWLPEKIYFFDVNNERDKKLKNKASRRFVPVHPILERLGFIEYVGAIYRQAKSKEERERLRLFPALVKRENGYSHDFVKWFSKFNRENVTEDRTKTFHSLRANVATALENTHAKSTYISRLLGHKTGTITGDRYVKDVEIRTLFEMVNDLHLYYKFNVNCPNTKTEHERYLEGLKD